MGMERPKTEERDNAIRALAVLDKAFLTRDFESLVVVTDDPNYRSKLTTFTIEHASIQTLTLLHFYKTLTRKLEEEIKLIAGP